MKKKLIAIAAGISVALTAAGIFSKANAKPHAPDPSKPMSYYDYAESIDLMEVINSNEPDVWERIENRNGKLIIERCIGEVLDAETGAGLVYNGDAEYNYISYRCVNDIQNGDVICTYFIYNTESNGTDDILHRFDYIIDRKG